MTAEDVFWKLAGARLARRGHRGPGEQAEKLRHGPATLGESFSFPGLGLLRSAFQIPTRGLAA